MIAMALACNPKLLIADEPTTALDVTTQAQILRLMLDLRDRIGTSIIMITHDLGIIAEMCDEVNVMYAGQIVEQANVFELFERPTHPYTRGLTLLLITHNLSVVAELCDRVMVMYLGRIVEQGPVAEIFDHPRHPYTIGLLGSRPTLAGADRLTAIPGQVPDLLERPEGCPFHTRCPHAQEVCAHERPPREAVAPQHFTECHFWQEVSG